MGSVVVGWGGGVGWWWVLCRPSRVAGGGPLAAGVPPRGMGTCEQL